MKEYEITSVIEVIQSVIYLPSHSLIFDNFATRKEE